MCAIALKFGNSAHWLSLLTTAKSKARNFNVFVSAGQHIIKLIVVTTPETRICYTYVDTLWPEQNMHLVSNKNVRICADTRFCFGKHSMSDADRVMQIRVSALV